MQFFNFGKKKANREAELEAVKRDTFNKIEQASKNLKKVNKLLSKDEITLQIFYATRKRSSK